MKFRLSTYVRFIEQLFDISNVSLSKLMPSCKATTFHSIFTLLTQNEFFKRLEDDRLKFKGYLEMANLRKMTWPLIGGHIFSL
jgi:hypothetical protein